MTEAIHYVVCLECGGRNRAGDDFCGDCGAYLAWEEQEPHATASDASVESPKGAAHPSLADETRGVGPRGAVDPPEPDAAERSTGATPPAASADDKPADTPALRKPSAATPPRRRPPLASAPAEPAPAPGDRICPSCGAGNRPDRHFCRRCAAQLTAPVAVTTSAQPTAGARPKGRNTRFPFTAVIVLAVVLGLIAAAWLNRDIVIGFVETIIGFVFSSQS
jgi:ribosomal protein L40E